MFFETFQTIYNFLLILTGKNLCDQRQRPYISLRSMGASDTSDLSVFKIIRIFLRKYMISSIFVNLILLVNKLKVR